jgi:threonine dehydratase
VIERERISEVERVIRPFVRRTPVIEVDAGDFGIGATTLGTGVAGDGAERLALKLELMQHAGSFKARGAFANLLTRKVPAAGVVAASGGNHGVAIAFAAKRLGVPAKIFVPRVASQEKVDRIRASGADLVIGGERYADAQAACEKWRGESGAMMVHPFDQVETMLGQGSVGIEFEAQAPEIDTLLVAVGGGGLIGGIASWYAGRVRIIGVEPEAAPTLFNAMRAGKPVDSEAGGIAADSLAP